MSSLSPTQLTLKKLRGEGWTCAVVEHWNSFAKIRQDLFGFGDILACRDKPIENILIVQCTTLSNVAARKKKISNNPLSLAWEKAGGRLQVWGWYKKKTKWHCRISDSDCGHWQDIECMEP